MTANYGSLTNHFSSPSNENRLDLAGSTQSLTASLATLRWAYAIMCSQKAAYGRYSNTRAMRKAGEKPTSLKRSKFIVINYLLFHLEDVG